MPNLNARKLTAGSPHLGHTCPFCHTLLDLNEEVVICPTDSSVLHVTCWRENGNRCAAFGCTGSGVVVGLATVAAAAPWPALNLRALALWGVAGLLLLLALFRIFDDPVVTQTTPAPINAIATARRLSQTATAEAATADAAAVAVIRGTALSDADGDGLLYEAESQYGTDAENRDSDGDGLEDGQEIDSYYDTDPLDADSDHDGLSDYREIRTFRTQPTDADTDDDGLDDAVEVLRGLDPREWTPPTPQPALRPTPRPAPPQPTATSPSPVSGLRLINTNSDRAIGPLNDGDTISLRNSGSALSIEALVSGSGVGSVVFHLDGYVFCMNNADRCFENAAPYAMSGDQGGDYYNNWDWSALAHGQHTVTVLTCTGANATGDCSEAMTVTFTIAR